jgi:hypothetical protein
MREPVQWTGADYLEASLTEPPMRSGSLVELVRREIVALSGQIEQAEAQWIKPTIVERRQMEFAAAQRVLALIRPEIAAEVVENSAQIGLPLEEMALLSLVKWDRYTMGPEGVSTVFGWIDRQDGRSDFVLLRPTREGCGVTTSSAEHSEAIGAALNGGEPTGRHQPCLRVEDDPESADLANVIRLCTCCSSMEEAEDDEFYHPANWCGVCGHPGPAHRRHEEANCPLKSGVRPCGCDIPRCELCGYTEHDAQFEGDHALGEAAGGRIPGTDTELWEEPWLSAPEPAAPPGPRFGERLRAANGPGASPNPPLERWRVVRLAAEIDADRDELAEDRFEAGVLHAQITGEAKRDSPESLGGALAIRPSELQRAVIAACSCGGQTDVARQCPACIVWCQVRARVQPEELEMPSA